MYNNNNNIEHTIVHTQPNQHNYYNNHQNHHFHHSNNNNQYWSPINTEIQTIPTKIQYEFREILQEFGNRAWNHQTIDFLQKTYKHLQSLLKSLTKHPSKEINLHSKYGQRPECIALSITLLKMYQTCTLTYDIKKRGFLTKNTHSSSFFISNNYKKLQIYYNQILLLLSNNAILESPIITSNDGIFQSFSILLLCFYNWFTNNERLTIDQYIHCLNIYLENIHFHSNSLTTYPSIFDILIIFDQQKPMMRVHILNQAFLSPFRSTIDHHLHSISDPLHISCNINTLSYNYILPVEKRCMLRSIYCIKKILYQGFTFLKMRILRNDNNNVFEDCELLQILKEIKNFDINDDDENTTYDVMEDWQSRLLLYLWIFKLVMEIVWDEYKSLHNELQWIPKNVFNLLLKYSGVNFQFYLKCLNTTLDLTYLCNHSFRYFKELPINIGLFLCNNILSQLNNDQLHDIVVHNHNFELSNLSFQSYSHNIHFLTLLKSYISVQKQRSRFEIIDICFNVYSIQRMISNTNVVNDETLEYYAGMISECLDDNRYFGIFCKVFENIIRQRNELNNYKNVVFRSDEKSSSEFLFDVRNVGHYLFDCDDEITIDYSNVFRRLMVCFSVQNIREFCKLDILHSLKCVLHYKERVDFFVQYQLLDVPVLCKYCSNELLLVFLYHVIEESKGDVFEEERGLLHLKYVLKHLFGDYKCLKSIYLKAYAKLQYVNGERALVFLEMANRCTFRVQEEETSLKIVLK